MGVLGTAHVIEQYFYVRGILGHGVEVLRPDEGQTRDLQRVIFDELTQGVVSSVSRDRLLEIGASLVARGADTAGLCCTDFGLLLDEDAADFAVVDSSKAPERSLLHTFDRQWTTSP